MLRRPAALVVGAGASKEVGLPTGADLRKRISELLNFSFRRMGELTSGDAQILEAIRYLVRKEDGTRGDLNPYIQSARHIRAAMPLSLSIDTFIDSHRSDSTIASVGKLAIVRAILIAERQSALYVDPAGTSATVNFAKLENTWFSRFFWILTQDCTKDSLSERFGNLCIITFNYDRCIEHYMHRALQVYFGISGEDAADALSGLRILHPYGKVGTLPWQREDSGIPFGADGQGTRLVELSTNIRTFTEQIEEEGLVSDIRDVIGGSEMVIFLGFGYNPQNVELIRPVSKSKVLRKIIGTGFGLSPRDCDIVAQRVGSFAVSDGLPQFVQIGYGLTCQGLFDQHWHELSFF